MGLSICGASKGYTWIVMQEWAGVTRARTGQIFVVGFTVGGPETFLKPLVGATITPKLKPDSSVMGKGIGWLTTLQQLSAQASGLKY